MATIGQRAAQPLTLRLRFGRWLALPLLLVGGLAILLGALALRPEPGFAVNMLAPLESLPFDMAGVNQVEFNGSQPYRWTTDYPFLQIRNAFNLAPQFQATLTIRSERPDGPQPVTFLLNEQPLAATKTTTDLRTYQILLPNRPDAENALRFAAATKNYTPPNDPRRLGFITTAWTLTPLFTIPALGPLTPAEIALVVLGGALLTAGLWWRAGRRMALTIGWSVPLALVILRLFYQPAPLPWTHLAIIALLATAAIPWLTQIVPSALGVAIINLIVTFVGALWPSWLTDDALISFRYAQNLVAGNGLVYNIGERVEGYTNFLWTMLAALVLALGGDPVTLSYYAGIVIAVLIVGLTFVLAKRFIGEGWALAAAAILGTSHSLLLYTSRGAGLETGLFALLLLVGSYLFLTDRFAWAGAMFALAGMTRPEGVLLLGIAVIVRLIEQRRLDRGIVRMVGVFLLLGVPFFVWRSTYYGDLLPNTFYAKTGGGFAQALRGLRHTIAFGGFAGGPVLVILLLGAIVALMQTWRRDPLQLRVLLLTWIVVGLYTAYIIAVGGDHFPGYRFFVPLLPFLALLMAAGLRTILHPLNRSGLRRAIPLLAVVVIVGLGGYNLTRSTAFDEIVRGDDESVWLWREIGWWLADNGQPGESMAVRGAGAIPYYSNRETIDLLGLTDKRIARMQVANMGAGVPGHEKQDPAYVLNERKPTYVPAIWADYFGTNPDALKQTGLYTREEVVTRYGRRIALWKRVR